MRVMEVPRERARNNIDVPMPRMMWFVDQFPSEASIVDTRRFEIYSEYRHPFHGHTAVYLEVG